MLGRLILKLFVILFITFLECQKFPRSNPLDPDSPQTVLGNLKGKITPVPSGSNIKLFQGNDTLYSISPLANGEFKFEYIKEGLYSIKVTAPSYIPSLIENIRVVPKKITDIGTIVLIPEQPDTTDTLRILSGRVIDSEKLSPIASASVIIDGRDTITDNNGNFIFYNLRPKVYTLKVSKEAYLEYITSVDLTKTSLNITIMMEAIAILEGTVTSTSNTPLKDVKVSINGFTTYTNSNGYYKFSGLPENTYLVKYEKQGYQTQFKEVQLKKGSVTTVNVQMAPKLSGILTGNIKDYKTNQPLPGVNVIGGDGADISGNDGNYYMEVTPGTFKVYFYKSGYYSKSHTVTVNNGQTVTLNTSLIPLDYLPPDTATISGVIKDSVTGEIINVRAYAIVIYTLDGYWVGENRDSTINGNFTLWNTRLYPYRKAFAPGEYIITIYSWGLPDPYLRYDHKFTVNSGSNFFVLKVKKGAILFAFVKNAENNQPIPNAYVSIKDGGGGSTNDQGFVKVSRIPPGFREIDIGANKFHTLITYENFTYGQELVRTFYLTPFADVLGTVKDSITGNPLNGVYVQLGSKETYTDSNGSYFFDGVEDGEFYINFSKQGYRSKAFKINVPYTGDLRIDVTLSPSGV